MVIDPSGVVAETLQLFAARFAAQGDALAAAQARVAELEAMLGIGPTPTPSPTPAATISNTPDSSTLQTTQVEGFATLEAELSALTAALATRLTNFGV